MINLLFFGQLGEWSNTVPATLPWSDALSSVQLLREHLAELEPRLGAALAQPQVMVAVNQQIVDGSNAIADGDEVAFLPPVTGG